MVDIDYDSRLLAYITKYVEEVGVPPTVDLMVANVEGLTSKSTVFHHLQKMVDVGLLVQKNVKGYYYPTSLDVDKSVTIPKSFLKRVELDMVKHNCDPKLIKELNYYVNM